jgi:hypothetical protein
MVDKRTELTSDDRAIMAVYYFGESAGGFSVGSQIGASKAICTRIEAYAEHGHMSMIPWIAIHDQEGICCRFAAEHVSIHY